MGWTNLPPTAGTDIQDYEFVAQFWYALQERYQVTGGCTPPQVNWPRHSFTFYHGTVPANVTATSFTDTHAHEPDGWADDPSYQDPWNRHLIRKDAPTTGGWYLVIDPYEPGEVVDGVERSADLAARRLRVVKTRITSWTATTLNYQSIADHVTAGYLASVGELAGKDYYIIRGDWGLWWHERLIEYPNDYEYAAGTVAAYQDDPNAPGVQTSPTAASLKDAGRLWAQDELAGKDLLVYAGGALRRVSVASNTADTMTFSSQLWTPSVGAAYCVVDAGGRAYPGKPPARPFAWYRGALEGTYGHHPAKPAGGGDYLRSAEIPAATVTHDDVAPYTQDCIPVFPGARDIDYFTEDVPPDERLDCGYPPDRPYAPDFWKTLRAIQIGCEDACPFFVEVNAAGGALSIPNFVPATFFRAAGINAFETSVTAVDANGDGATVTPMPLPWSPIELYYAVLNDKGEPIRSGTVEADSPDHLNGGGFHTDPDPTKTDLGRKVVLSLGWTRDIPREFRRMYDKACFIPDTSGEPPQAIVPANVKNFAQTQCLGVGRWVTRGRSSDYCERGIYGPGETKPFATGDFARYVGDNWNDPVEGDEATREYHDHFYTGLFPKEVQDLIDVQRRGRATGGGTSHLTDAAQDWWNDRWYDPVSNAHVESGTAGTGSTDVQLVDPTKAAGAARCFWAPERFENFGGPYLGFTVEILTDGADWDAAGAVIERRLITSSSLTATSATIGWNRQLPGACTGRPYRIREPRSYELNRWKGRNLRVTRSDRQVAETTIVGNDDHTLFLAPPLEEAVGPGSVYEIVDPPTGTVWQWDGTRWQVPSGAGECAATPPPTVVRRYGRYLHGDYVTTTLFAELYRAINALRHTKEDVVWSTRLDPSTPEITTRSAFQADLGQVTDPGRGGLPGSWAQNKANADCQWAKSMAQCWASGGPDEPCLGGDCEWNEVFGSARPSAVSSGSLLDFGGCSAGKARTYAYCFVDSIPTCVPSTVKIWVVADVPGGKVTSDFRQCPDCECAHYVDPTDGCGNCDPYAWDNVPPYEECYASSQDSLCRDCCGGCSSEFSTHGDGSFGRGTWGEIATAEVGPDGATRRFRVGGALTAPVEWCAQPAYSVQGQYNDAQRGYIVNDGAAVVYWRFTYTD